MMLYMIWKCHVSAFAEFLEAKCGEKGAHLGSATEKNSAALSPKGWIIAQAIGLGLL